MAKLFLIGIIPQKLVITAKQYTVFYFTIYNCKQKVQFIYFYFKLNIRIFDSQN